MSKYIVEILLIYYDCSKIYCDLIRLNVCRMGTIKMEIKFLHYSSQRAHRSRQYERGSSAERRFKRSNRRSPTSKKHRHHHEKTTVSRKKHRSYSTDQVSIKFICNNLEQLKYGAVRKYFWILFIFFIFTHYIAKSKYIADYFPVVSVQAVQINKSNIYREQRNCTLTNI